MTPEEYRDPWFDQRATMHQAAVADADLTTWLAGAPHASFDAFRTLISSIAGDCGSLLECGCGTGYYSAVLHSFAPHIAFTGMDVAPNQIARARQAYPGISFVEGDVRSIPFGDRAFDIVDLAAVIQHLPDYRPAILEARRVSKRYVLLHRVQATTGQTNEFLNDAYEVPLPTREINEQELLKFCGACRLGLCECCIWGDPQSQFNASFLLERRDL